MILGILEQGLIYGILALGLLITYRILDFPDLTVDSSFPLGAAVSAVLTVAGHPVLGLLCAFLAGALAGSVTGVLQTKVGIHPILAGILTMSGLYTINTAVMGGKPDVTLTKTTIFNKLYEAFNINLQAFNRDRQAFTMAKEITVLIVAAVFFYGFCLYRYYDDIVALFSSVFGERILNSSRKGERLRSDIFYGSLGKLFMLGVGFVGLIAGVVCLRMGLALPDSVTFYMPLTAMAAFLVVVALQYVMLGVVGFVTSSLDGVASLMRIRLVYFVLATLIVAPVLLVSMMGQSAGYDLWFKAALVAAGVVSVLFIRESIKFFIHKKVSILHWILYLCTVEILPLTLLWQVVDRVR